MGVGHEGLVQSRAEVCQAALGIVLAEVEELWFFFCFFLVVVFLRLVLACNGVVLEPI